MKNVAKLFCLLSLCLITLSSCEKMQEDPLATKIVIEAKTLLDVPYGGEKLQKMDVYLPTNRTPNTSVIIFVHGGSFIEGDKSSFTAMVKELVRADFAVLNVNYRLVDGSGLYSTPVKHVKSAIKVQDQVNDMSLVVDYAISHAKEWQVSESKIAMAGHSAGATLALLYAYGVQNTNKVKAVTNLAGSLDQTFTDIPLYYILLPDYILEAGYRYTGYLVSTTNDQYYRDISPLYVANTNQKVPTLNVFPEFNEVNGSPKQNRKTFDAFTTKLNSLGIPNKFVEVAGANHEFSKIGNFDIVLKETIAYFTTHLK